MNEAQHDNWLERNHAPDDTEALRRKAMFCLKRHLAPVGSITPSLRARYYTQYQLYRGMMQHGF